jgi:hypothetical protein
MVGAVTRSKAASHQPHRNNADQPDAGDIQPLPSEPAPTSPPSVDNRSHSVRDPDGDEDMKGDVDEDPSLAESVRPPAYFPPVDLEAWNASDLRKLQLGDSFAFSKLKAFIMPGAPVVWGTQRADLPLAEQSTPAVLASEFVMNSDSILCHRSRNGPPCIVVPDSLKAFVLRRHHGIPLAGHSGRRKVLKTIRTRYWWKGTNRDVTRWIRACLVCRRRKTPRPLHAGQPRSNPLPPYPWHTAAIELVGPLNETIAGDKYLLTILDTFTRWVIAVPIRSKESHVVADALYRNLLTKHGCPSVIYSDQGTEFVNAGLKSMCKSWGIRKLETTGWQPQANPVERVHRWLNASLATLRQKFGGEWNNYVDDAVFAYNTSIHDTTGFAPFKLLYGRHPTLPDDLLFGTQSERSFDVESEYSIYCSQQQAIAYKALIANQTDMATRNRLCRDTHQQDVAFNPGEQVLYWQPASGKPSFGPSQNDDLLGSSDAPADDGRPMANAAKKHMHPWTGPHVITRGVDDNHFEFLHSKTGRTVTSHLNRLTRFFPWSDDLPSPSPEFDAERKWKTSGDIPADSTVLVEVVTNTNTSLVPFRVGRLISIASHPDQDGRITVQWLGNRSDNARGTYRPSWRTPSSRIYYSNTPTHQVDVPHATSLLRHHVILHSFPLLASLKLPNGVLRAAQSSGRSLFPLFE